MDGCMKILIIGGMGFIGRNLVFHLSMKHDVTVMDSMEPWLEAKRCAEIYPEPDFIKASIFNSTSLADLISTHDFIINCAGQTSHPLSMSKPFYDITLNCDAPLTVLETVREENSKATLIYLSSSTIIGRQEVQRHNAQVEIGKPNPVDIYSANKLAAEHYHEIYRLAYDLKVMVLRLPNVFGPHGKYDPSFGFVNYFIGRALDKKPITVYGRGDQMRNVLYINDVVAMVEAMISHSMVSPVILANNRSLSVKEIAMQIAHAFDVEVERIPYPSERKKLEIGDVHLFSPWAHGATSLEEGLWDMKRMLK
jgi:nucleoside-diphosphate-sugar epimerase